MLCTPVFGRDGDIIGVLQVTNKRNGKVFRVKDEVALAAMSAHISRAMERAFVDPAKEQAEASDAEELLGALRASFEHHRHHLKFATSRAGGAAVELVGDGKPS